MNEQAYFSWANFSEIADLNGHISFASDVIRRHEWSPEVRALMTDSLKRITDKQNDRQLNLSVIGEFATGKSSFINALIRQDLLATSALQGTTVATTVIEHADTQSITVTMLNGRTRTRRFFSVFDLHNALEDLTTNPATARQIHTVSVGLPSPGLRRGIRIIDTPGTNATEQWHEDVTRRAIRELSDLSVILVDATRPLPETFCAFIEDNLADVLPQCVFVLTKFDLVRAVERRMMLSYVQKKLSSMGCTNPLVLPYVSPAVIHTFSPSAETIDDAELLSLSTANEEQLFRHMAQMRVQAQARKLLALTTQMYDTMALQVQTSADESRRQLDLLLKTRQADLASFVARQKLERQAEFARMVTDSKAEAEDTIERLTAEAKARIMAKVEAQPNLDQLKAYVSGTLADDCKTEANLIVEKTAGAHQATRECFRQVMDVFQRNFEQLFTDLKILKIDFTNSGYQFPAERVVNTANLGAAADYVSGELSKENWAFFGGAAAGAALGSIIAPGVGTVIGAIGGFIFGGGKAPKIEDVRVSLKKKMQAPLNSFFSQTASSITNSQNEYRLLLQQNIATEIDRYLDTYHSIVNMRIERQQKQRATVQHTIDLLNGELRLIDQRRTSLQSIAAHIQ